MVNASTSWKWMFILWYLIFIFIFPILSLLKGVQKVSFFKFFEIAFQPIAVSAYATTFSSAFFACLCNTVFGLLLAWVLVRYQFPGKRFIDSAIDLPFSIPTSVAGLTLATVYGPSGWVGQFLDKFGIQIVFTWFGVVLAMIFVSFPFMVRTLQPVLEEIEKESEEAAFSLGASPWQVFWTIVFPSIVPALLTGMTLAFSRAIGEYGSVVVVSANIPFQDLIASVLIFQKLEQYDTIGAAIIGTVILFFSLFLLLGINGFQSWHKRQQKPT
uniref:Sulfate transport system permease protein CysT n=1 Tax=Xylochloris irregularis TaxID=480381 RepID=A0A097KM91_9CHLO|nr:probable transport protein [Xylochloris irregularis]AIT94298.1 probable transport protein [Xylochloris irregularis]